MVSRRERRLQNLRRQREKSNLVVETKKKTPKKVKSSSGFSSIKSFYENKYKLLMIIPIAMFVFALLAIGNNYVQTGDFINKGVSLKGGITVNILEPIDINSLEEAILNEFVDVEVNIRELSDLGNVVGAYIEADIDLEDRDRFISLIEEQTSIDAESFSIEEIGPSLGESFFRQTFRALVVAFLFMGLIVFLYFGESALLKALVAVLSLAASALVFGGLMYIALIFIIALVYLYFRYSVPSAAVILAALSDIIITLAIVDAMGMKIGTAGIAAFLMLIGYSVDTDILLSTRVLKRKSGTVMDGVYEAMRTGLTMNLTTIAAVTVALLVTESPVISQIMTIILIGLLVDIVNTWIQNVGILRYYLEKKKVRK